MKNILFVILCIFSTSAFGQELFHIIHVKGEVTVKKSGKRIVRGDKISSNEEIVFASKQDMMAALSSKKGRIIIKPDMEAPEDSELSSFLKDFVTAASGKLSTRGVQVNLLDLQNHFEGDYLVLGGRSAIALSPKAFPLNDKSFFYLRYEYMGEVINKKLSSSSDSLVFIESEIYKVDDKPIDKSKVADMTLFYYESEWEHSQKINTIYPIFPPDSEVVPGVQILIDTLKKSNYTDDTIKDEIEAYLTDIYGKIHSSNLNKWLKMNFNL